VKTLLDLSSGGSSLRASQKLQFRQDGCFHDWIRQIREVCARGGGSTLELARLLNRAKRALPYGGWSRLWQGEGVPFSKRKGEMLVLIGETVGGLDAQNSAQLPAAWNTLYFIARLGRQAMEQLIHQGRIHRGLTLREAQELLGEYKPEKRRGGSRSMLLNRLRRFAAFVRANLQRSSEDERETAAGRLLVLAREIQVVKLLESNETEPPGFDSRPFVEHMVRPHSTHHTL
jgi:hypothetical protein